MTIQPSRAEPQPPSLLVFYHIPKTGGTTTREWLLRNAGLRSRGLPMRLQGFVRYWEATCFFCMQFSDLLGVTTGCDAKMRRKCTKEYTKRPASFDFTKSSWRLAGPLAVEFHGPTEGSFVQTVLPQAEALRALYRQHNGTCRFATIVRDPIDFLFSSFHMWPPRPPRTPSSGEKPPREKRQELARRQPTLPGRDAVDASGPVVPFPRWVAGAAGLQVGFLTDPKCVAVTRAEGHRNTCGCDASARQSATKALRLFDIVGLTSCLPNFMDTVEVSMAWTPPDHPAGRLQRRSRGGNATAGLLQATPRCTDCTALESAAHARWSWEALSAEQRRATREVARCDEAIYRLALSRTRGPRHGHDLFTATFGRAPPPEKCHPRERIA